uniref:RING-type domain-containing protein n=1 Tax=Biomphalaria glabrata TaxID=6526 RepID=A0A2C9JCA3_BIOGL
MMASQDDFVLQLNDRLSDAKKANSLPCCLIDRPVDQVSNGRADDFFTEAQKQQPNDPTDFNNLDQPANNKDALIHDGRLCTQDDCMHTSTSLNLQSTSTLETTDDNVELSNTSGENSYRQTEYSVTLQVPVHVFEIRIEVHLEGYDVLHTNLYCQLISHEEVKMSFQQDGQKDRINQSLQYFDHPGCHSLISLSLKHLPADVQVDSLLLFVKLFSLLIVKINHRRRLRTQTAAVCGTGLIFERPAEIRIQEDTGRCEGHIFIATSENLIPNEAEARACEVTFSSRAMKYFKVRKLAVDSVEHVSKSGETNTYLKCRTSDMAFVSVLNTIQEKVKMLANDLPLSVKQRLTKTALVISYPHGDEMTMSYGDCAVIKRKLSDETVDGNRHLWLQNLTASGSESPHETVQVLLHTAPTCIGSLGAPIITFKQNIASSVEQDQYSLSIWTHDGVLEPSEFGCSSIKACTEDELRLYSGVMVALTSNQPHLSSVLNTQHNGTSRMLSTRQQTQLAEVHNAQVSALQTEVQPQQVQVPAHETEVESQQTQLPALETEVESQQKHLPALETEVESQQTQLPALETEVESQQTQLPALETEVESQQTQLPVLETEVESQQTQLPALETEVESQQTQLPALETEVESQQTEACQLDLQQTQETLQEVRQSGPHHHDLLRPNFNNLTDREDSGPNLAIQPPSYPAYIRFEKRLESFVGWLSGNILSPATLARNGFFYAGYSDCVRCYYCGIGLKSWKLGDDVVTEHQRFRPNCHFLIKLLASDFNVRPGGYQMPSQEEILDSHESQESAGRISSTCSPRGTAMDNNVVACLTSSETELKVTLLPSESPVQIGCDIVVMQALVSQPEYSSIDQKSEAGEINPNSTDQTSSSLKTERNALSEGGPQAVQDITVRLLQEEKKRLEALMQCKVCSKNPIKSLFLPCGDLYACQECSGNLSHCPQCNKKILATVTTYFS